MRRQIGSSLPARVSRKDPKFEFPLSLTDYRIDNFLQSKAHFLSLCVMERESQSHIETSGIMLCSLFKINTGMGRNGFWLLKTAASHHNITVLM